MVATLHLTAAGILALALAFVSEVHGQGQDKCTTATWQNTSGSVIKYQQLHLPAPLAQWQVTITPVCSQPNGIKVSACDSDTPPTVVIQNQYGALVTRTGGIQGDAIVDITAYCPV